MRKSALLIIDGQNDFVLPTGKLSVAGAVEDMDRVVKLIMDHGDKFHSISCTLDSHRTIDISHPAFWNKADGTPVDPFTPISYQDLVDGKYTPNFHPKWAFSYVKQLEDQGEFGHFIWPYHCLIGSTGAALYEPLTLVLNAWEEKNKRIINYVTKGDNPYTEHFGAFRANIEMAEDPKTQFNQKLIQLVNEAPSLASKVIVLEDCMSDVPGLPQGFYDQVKAIYEDSKAKGVRFETTQTINLS